MEKTLQELQTEAKVSREKIIQASRHNSNDVKLSVTVSDHAGNQTVAEERLKIDTVSTQTRKNFVYVPQGNTLFSGTIRDNLLMGNPQASEEAIYQALQTATADFVFHLPDGVDSPLSERGGGLSEGQAQRIAIARALLRPGNILLLDEATSALDPDTERLLIKNLRRDCAGKTCIFVTHHPAVAEACESIVRL